MGRHAGTASYDSTWRLWDLESGAELLLQEGHAREVYCLAFQGDGALVSTADLGAVGRVWDIRSGKSIFLMQGKQAELTREGAGCQRVGKSLSLCLSLSLVYLLPSTLGLAMRCAHMSSISYHLTPLDLRLRTKHLDTGHGRQLLAMDWSPNGYQLATASDDHTVRIWDMRKQKGIYTVPAHCSLISSVRFSSSGELLVTASHDATVKCWSARDYSVLKTLEGHEGKVMCVDVRADESQLVTCGHDRTFKLWAHEDEF